MEIKIPHQQFVQRYRDPLLKEEADALRGCISAEQDIANIIRCYKKYNPCNHRYKKAGYLFYRVQQAACALFGKSDWQIARKSLQNQIQNGMTIDNHTYTGKMTAKKAADIALKSQIKLHQCVFNSLTYDKANSQYTFSNDCDINTKKINDRKEELLASLEKQDEQARKKL